MERNLDMIDWEKNFAVIVQKSNPFILIGRGGNPVNDIIEFYDRAFGHAVMVLKIDGEMYYKGYRFSIEGEQKFRKLRYKLYIDAQIQPLQNEEITKNRRYIENILRRGVRAEILDESKRYRPRHQHGVFGTIRDDLVYYDLNYEEKEVNAIWDQVKQDEEKEKYYSLNPDIAKNIGDFPENALVHNCVTWIVETECTSVENPFLPRIDDGNISLFVKKLCEIGDTRETDEPD